jgi:hypothetical protein
MELLQEAFKKYGNELLHKKTNFIVVDIFRKYNNSFENKTSRFFLIRKRNTLSPNRAGLRDLVLPKFQMELACEI